MLDGPVADSMESLAIQINTVKVLLEGYEDKISGLQSQVDELITVLRYHSDDFVAHLIASHYGSPHDTDRRIRLAMYYIADILASVMCRVHSSIKNTSLVFCGVVRIVFRYVAM